MQPAFWIAISAGFDGSVVVSEVVESPANEGFNAKTDQYENLLSTGVIEPAKVTRVALGNAASIAGRC